MSSKESRRRRVGRKGGLGGPHMSQAHSLSTSCEARLVGVILQEDLLSLVRAQVEADRAQRVAQLAHVDPARAVLVYFVEGCLDLMTIAAARRTALV